MSKRWRWLASTLFVALLVWVAWSVRGGTSERAEAKVPVAGVVLPVEPPPAVEAPLDEALPTPDAAAHDRVPAGPAEVVADPTRARIAVLVVARGTGVPVPGVAVSAYYTSDDPRRPQATPSASTDTDGRVELEVDVESAVHVYASGSRGGRSAGVEPVGPANVLLEPLSPGERREVRLEVPVGRDLVFFGRVVDETTEQPVPGARAVELRGELEVEADGEGLLELHVPSWNPGVFELTAAGYGLRRFVPTAGHERADGARALPLLPVASLRVHVIDEGSEPLDGLSVRLSVESWELDMPDESLMLMTTGFSSRPEKSWSADCAADGTCELEGLPARVPLEAKLLRDRRVVLQPGSFGLDPGEAREVEWRLNTGTRVVGVVLDQDGAPVERCPIGRFSTSAAPSSVSDRWLLHEHTYDRAAETTSSDAEGRFAFEDVKPGIWWIGPCPPKSDPREIVAVTVRVEVPSGVLEFPIELRVERGAYIRGRVLTPDGSVPQNAWVSAFGESVGGGRHDNMEDDGSFRVGPLPAGVYHLQARGFRDYAPSRPLVANAGDADVVLQLEWAGSIAGRAVGVEDGLARQAEISIYGTGDVQLRMIASTEKDGSFEIRGLEAGVYDLTAASPDGLVAVLRGVEVAPNATNAGRRFDLSPGARVEVRYEGVQDYGSYDIRCGGSVVVFNSLKRGATAVHTVPPGAIEIEHRDGGKPVETRHLELGVGKQETVVFTPN